MNKLKCGRYFLTKKRKKVIINDLNEIEGSITVHKSTEVFVRFNRDGQQYKYSLGYFLISSDSKETAEMLAKNYTFSIK